MNVIQDHFNDANRGLVFQDGAATTKDVQIHLLTENAVFLNNQKYLIDLSLEDTQAYFPISFMNETLEGISFNQWTTMLQQP